MKIRSFFFANVFFVLVHSACGSDWTLLPNGSLVKPIILDSHAAQASGSILAYQVRNSLEEKVYSPINIGFQRMLIRYTDDLEFGIEFGIHSQYTVVDAGEAPLGGLQNIDYRIAGVIHYSLKRSVLRLSLFHQSSHLGDDYIIRNMITRPTPNTLNYEELSLIRFAWRGGTRTYAGAGYNISPHTVRERIMLTGGYFWKQPEPRHQDYALAHGVHLKIFEENDYHPNIKVGLGFEVRYDPENFVIFMLEYYKGHLPYSTLEYQKVQLYGVGAYFNL